MQQIEQLSKSLKELCDENGKEKIENLNKTSEILDKLGQAYMNIGSDKLSLIRSAVFFNAAIQRQQANDVYKTHLKELCLYVLKASPAKHRDADLMKIAQDVTTKVREMRDHTEKSLLNIHLIKTGLSGADLRKAEENKIFLVRNLQNEITSRYHELMANISETILNRVMGNPPEDCKFSIVGMGSIARKEITPYSDFEHIILLEEGLQYRHKESKYEEILEYFRWFSAIFHIIVVNMGETIIRSVAAPFLNDKTLSDGDWFFDDHTPCGIKFDGMQKTAWKFPLGKMEGSGKFELIKPIDEMVNFLVSSKENEDFGYLSDILIKTIFVFGDEDIHDTYRDRVQEKVRENPHEIASQMKTQLEENLEEFNSYVNIAAIQASKSCNIKYLIYRTSTIFISHIGRLFSSKCFSCFEIIESLFSSGNAHKLQYAIAVGCEARLKMYTAKKGADDRTGERNYVQSNAKTLTKLKDVLGEQSLGDYFVIAHALHMLLKCEDHHDILVQELNCSLGQQAMIFMNLDLRYRCKELEEHLVSDEPRNIRDELLLRHSIARFCERDGKFDKMLTIIQWEKISEKVFRLVGYAIQQELHSFEFSDELLSFVSLMVLAMQCFVLTKRYADLEKSLNVLKPFGPLWEKHLESKQRKVINALINFFEADVKARTVGFSEALVCGESALEDLESLVDQNFPITKEVVAECHRLIGTCLANDASEIENAIRHGEKALRLHRSSNSPTAFECECCSLLGYCHLLKNQSDRALAYFEKNLSIRQVNESNEHENYEILLCKNYIKICKTYQENGFLQGFVQLSNLQAALLRLKIGNASNVNQPAASQNTQQRMLIEYLSNNLSSQPLNLGVAMNDFLCNLH